MMKPTVHYRGKAEFYKRPLATMHKKTYGQYTDQEGNVEYASVYGIDHPILGEDTIRTSIVLHKYDDGSFETMNTIYIPDKEKHESE